MNEQEAQDLLIKFRSNQCTAEELAILDRYFLHELKHRELPDGAVDFTAVHQRLRTALPLAPVATAKRRVPVYFRYAAAVVAIVGITSTYYYYTAQHKPLTTTNIAKDILPGGNTATLTLANGKEISLNAQTGAVATAPGMLISNNPGNGVVTYQLTKSKPAGINRDEINPAEVNTVTTPKGGQYQMVLSDGTRVYLNAASRLQFFVRFAGGERKVTLSGEAYFEVAKDAKRPFIVITEGQTLQVLGTHFNVSAYPNETIKTTLAEGSVKLTSSLNSSSLQNQTLKPDQQALLLSTGKYQVANVQAADALAWKDGYFLFRETPLSEAIQQICRWYNIDADFPHLPNISVSAYLLRTRNLTDLIRLMELNNGIKITLTNERRLIVTKK